MTVNLKNLLNPNKKISKMGDFQELERIEGLSISAVSADLYGNGRDDLSIDEKVKLDYEYIRKKNILFDIKILFLTILRLFKNDNENNNDKNIKKLTNNNIICFVCIPLSL